MSSLHVFSIAIIAVICFAYAASADPCNSLTSCNTCVSNSSYRCGWCSDWNGCMSGGQRGPYQGQCSSWHADSCVGVSIPRTTTCSGNPISAQRIRQMMGAGKTSANITSTGTWTVQSRTCNPVTGCTNWEVTPNNIPTTSVTLQVEGSTVHVNVITGYCKYSSCTDYGYQIKFFGTSYARYGFESGSVGEKELDFGKVSVPVMSCGSSSCGASNWYAPDGIGAFRMLGQLTDNCFHVRSDWDDSSKSFLELYVTF